MQFSSPNSIKGPIISPVDLQAYRGRLSSVNYFASNQGQVYVGPYLVDEVVAIGYNISQSKVPIYGYASQYFDKVADGKVLVNGYLTINYTDSNYLFSAIDKYIQDRIFEQGLQLEEPNSPTGFRSQILGANQKTGFVADLMKDLVTKMDQDPWARPNVELLKRISFAIGEQHESKEYLVQALKRKFWGEDDKETNIAKGLTRNYSAEKLKETEELFTERDITDGDVTDMPRPDQMPSISITVAHGDPADYASATYRVITDVHFLGCEQNINIADDPQTETYKFLARSIVY